MRSIREVGQILERAFRPCDTGLDHKAIPGTFRFLVRDARGSVLIDSAVFADAEIVEDHVLRSVIDETRRALEAKGVALEPFEWGSS